MPIDPFLLLAPLWGGLLGIGYFGGLWWTLRRLSDRLRPRLWLALSFGIRLLAALAGFWLALRRGPGALLLALAGFFLARTYLIRRLGPPAGAASPKHDAINR